MYGLIALRAVFPLPIFLLLSLLILPARVRSAEVTYCVVARLLQQQLSQPAVSLQLATGWLTP